MSGSIGPRAQANVPATNIAGETLARVFAFPVTTAMLTLNNILRMGWIPAGATVVDVILHSTDLDTGGSPTITLSVGDDDDDDYYITANTVAQAGGLVRMAAATAAPKTYAAQSYINVTVKAAPATAAAGTVTLTVLYACA